MFSDIKINFIFPYNSRVIVLISILNTSLTIREKFKTKFINKKKTKSAKSDKIQRRVSFLWSSAGFQGDRVQLTNAAGKMVIIISDSYSRDVNASFIIEVCLMSSTKAIISESCRYT